MPRIRIEKPHLELRRGKYCIVWWSDGKRNRLSTGSADEAEGRRALVDFECQLEKHPLKMLMSDAFKRYIESRRGKVSALKRLQEAVMALDRAMGHLRVDQIEQRIWDQYAATRMRKLRKGDDQAIPVAAGTLRREFNVLRATMRRVWKDGYLVRPPEIEPPRDSAPRDRYLTHAIDILRRQRHDASLRHVRHRTFVLSWQSPFTRARGKDRSSP